jgi:hypothetical protein
MEEQEKNQHVMTEEEFQNELHNKLKLIRFDCVRRFKSVGRAFRRGDITNYGEIVPRRHFHNRKNTCKHKGHHSRAMNELKKRLYGEYLFRERYHGRRV